jgi:hypothetical protein
VIINTIGGDGAGGGGGDDGGDVRWFKRSSYLASCGRENIGRKQERTQLHENVVLIALCQQ